METLEKGHRQITSAPENWIIGGHSLLWPPTDANQKRKKQVAPENDWTLHNCKILGPPFSKILKPFVKEFDFHSNFI